MNSIPCSVGMLTYNSAPTLRRILESVKAFDDIILCDGGSTDDTHAIAKEYGARIIAQDARYKVPGGNRLIDGAGARNQMIDAAKYDWFLMLDSDESISAELGDDIARITTAPDKKGSPLVYRVPIRMYVGTRLIKHSSNYPGYQTRFFNKKSGGRFVRAVHNRMDFAPGTVFGTLAHPWYVYLDPKELGIFQAERGWYRQKEVQEACARTLPDFLRWIVWFHFKAAAGIFLRSLGIYVRHGFKDSMPLTVEIGRTLGPLTLIAKASACRVRKLFV